MSAAATSPDPASPPSPAARLLNAVRKLIDYGKQLAASLHQGSITSVVANAFGTADIALILARITQGLHRALVLEERIVRTAARLDADPRSKPASSARAPHASRPPTPRATEAEPDLTPLPTPEQITAKARRQAGTATPHHQIQRQLRPAGHRHRPPAVSARCPTRPRAIAR
jgi:hypothetical protein